MTWRAVPLWSVRTTRPVRRRLCGWREGQVLSLFWSWADVLLTMIGKMIAGCHSDTYQSFRNRVFFWHFYLEFLTIIWTEGGDWPEAQDRHQAPSLSISVMRETLTPRYSSMWAARGSRSSGTLSASSRDLAWVVFMTAVAALRCLKSVIGQSEESLMISSQRLMLDTFWLKANSSLTALRATSSPSWTSTGRDSCTWWRGSVWRHFLKSWPTGD